MDIQLIGRKSASKALIENASKFLAKELNLTNSKYTLLIMTERGMAKNEGMRGVVSKIGPKCLSMIIDSDLDTERLIITLAHEMVHVKQYARGQIKSSRSRKTHYWMGKNVRKKYYEQPWEVEAFTKERVLANKLFVIMNQG
jgi:Zn-dependent peptidase ImmA (M78 family)